jgi:hypothetical protein
MAIEQRFQLNKKIVFSVAFAAVFILVCWWFAADIRQLFRAGDLRPEYPRAQFHGKRLVKTEEIQLWMTFDYLNKVFSLPPDYLIKSLEITDARYPNLSLTQYARHNNINENDLLDLIKKEIDIFQKN